MTSLQPQPYETRAYTKPPAQAPAKGNGAAPIGETPKADTRGEAQDGATIVPVKSRKDLLLSSWLTRDIPERDRLLGDVLCTTSRWLIFGETGVGKTLLAMDLLGAVAKGEGFLTWEGRKTARSVMYLDGELPAETFKERMELIAGRYGPDLALYGYNRDVLPDGEMPPLNTHARDQDR